MGAKRARTRQPIFLYTAGLLICCLMVVGCLHWPPASQGKQQLRDARQRLASGDYAGALDINRRVLTQFPSSLADQSLFQIGQIYAHPHNPDRDVQKAMASFQSIIDQYPGSRLCPEAELWLTLLRELKTQQDQIHTLTQRHAPLEKKLKMQQQKIQQLRDQLEKFKRIDIKIEEKKRNTLPQTEDFEAKKDIAGFTPSALQKLMLHDWPGNVRELENTIECAVALATENIISEASILPDHNAPKSGLQSLKDAKENFEKNYLIQLIELTGGNVSQAAKLAGKYRADLYRLL